MVLNKKKKQSPEGISLVNESVVLLRRQQKETNQTPTPNKKTAFTRQSVPFCPGCPASSGAKSNGNGMQLQRAKPCCLQPPPPSGCSTPVKQANSLLFPHQTKREATPRKRSGEAGRTSLPPPEWHTQELPTPEQEQRRQGHRRVLSKPNAELVF